MSAGQAPPAGRAGRDDAGSVSLVRRRTRPTRRSWLLLLLAGLLYAAGSNASAGWVIVLAALALGAVPWAWVSARWAARTVQVRRVLPSRVTAGRPVSARLEISARTPAMAVVEDDLLGAAGVAGGLKDTATLHTEVTLRRGVLVEGEVRVLLADPFGLVEVLVAATVPTFVEVLPDVPLLDGGRPAAAWALEAGEEATRPGHGTELVGVREYRHGDPVHAIHWRATARQGQPIVRELAEPARPRVRVELGTGPWEQDALDRAAELAAAVASDAVRHGAVASVAADGDAYGWGPLAHRLLALLPPHPGAPARPLAPVPPADAEVVVALTGVTLGVSVRIIAGETSRDLGVLPVDGDGTPAVADWLAMRRAWPSSR